MLVLPAPLAARWGGVLAAAGYAVLAGWGVPAQRTLWMLAVHCCAGAALAVAVVLLAAARGDVSTLGHCCSRASGCRSRAVGMLMASEPDCGRYPTCDALAGAGAACRADAARGAAHAGGRHASAWRR